MHADPGWWSHAWFWLEVHLGIHDLSGPYYGFWSGFGSDLGELTIVAAIVGAYRAANCHVHKCWRIGKHQIAGGRFKVCKTHHPDIPDQITAEHISDAHTAHLERVTVK